MTWYLLALLAVGAVVVGVAGDRLVGYYLARRVVHPVAGVVVRLRSGRRFRGTMTLDGSPWLVVTRPELLQEGTPPVLPLDGEVHLPREGVEYVQVLHDNREVNPWVREPQNGERRAV